MRGGAQPATITRHEGDTEVAPAKTSHTGIANKYDDGFTVISLPLTHVNPSSQASVDAVLEHFAEESKLGGGIGQRKWEFIVADLGATNMKDVDDPSTISGQSFFSVMCTGHEMFALEAGIMRVIFNTWGKCLIQLCGFTSSRALEYAKTAGSHHKTKEMLIDIFQPAMLAALITEFAVDSDDNVMWEDNVLLSFEAWGKEKAKTDVHFNEAWYIFTSLLPAYSLLCKGIASNNVLAYRAARATLYP